MSGFCRSSTRRPTWTCFDGRDASPWCFSPTPTSDFATSPRRWEDASGTPGRNLVGEVIDHWQESRIEVVLYASLIYDTWAYRNHPDWRIIGPSGEPVAERSRYGVCCPNSPYRPWVVSLAGEICESFDVAGIRFDMTFHCRSVHLRVQRPQARGGDGLPSRASAAIHHPSAPFSGGTAQRSRLGRESPISASRQKPAETPPASREEKAQLQDPSGHR
ncbi:MAG: hypothetical protein HYU36_24145 [Planctomycetes bacterium]|nr:hypothetical protein [Planctomycetota bacterium]